jgi:hypothetical protein
VFSPARDRAEDLQAESRAMTRAAAATVYSPELLASRYGSQPFQAHPELNPHAIFILKLAKSSSS